MCQLLCEGELFFSWGLLYYIDGIIILPLQDMLELHHDICINDVDENSFHSATKPLICCKVTSNIIHVNKQRHFHFVWGLWFMFYVLCVFCLKQRITPVPRQTKGEFDGFLNMIGVGTTIHHSKDCMDVQVTEVEGQASSDICNIKLITDGEFMVF